VNDNQRRQRTIEGYNVSLTFSQVVKIRQLFGDADVSVSRIIIESTNLDGVVAVRIGSRTTLVSASGATLDI
jgi:hypothetical protein